MLRPLIIFLWLMVPRILLAADGPPLEEQVRALAGELRCVVCQNLSVADSPSEMAQQMRAIIREQLEAGKTPDEIKTYFVSKYGQWVLLAPVKSGFSLLLWVLPFVALVLGILFAVFLMWRWARRTSQQEPGSINSTLLARVRTESSAADARDIDPEDSSARAQLLNQRARLYDELKELEFDYQAGKLSETDYDTLRAQLESKAAGVLRQLDSSVSSTAPVSKAQATASLKSEGEPKASVRRWKLAAGGAFLLMFGLLLGIILTKSLRPRASEQDSITGDFLTGTVSSTMGKNEVTSLLAEGKDAFHKRHWPAAIEAFKKVLAADPNQPEAHTYMGFILIEAGHAEGALLAFDRALAATPNFPAALWGKGMILYREKQDYAGARQVFEKLVTMLPAGQERAQVEKLITEISQAGTSAPTTTSGVKTENVASQQIRGKITLDPKVKNQADGRATLFIIARRANADAGPPLAVRKIERPSFPVSYSLGAENVMMQGLPFSGKLNVSARLDKDGNPATREAGNLVGEHKKNPVEVGANNVDIIIDQVIP